MARTRSISSIEAEITKVKAELKKAPKKVDALTEQLLRLKQLKQDYEANMSWMHFVKAEKAFRNY